MTDKTGVWGVVVAAGEGRRFGGVKQFEALGGRRVLDWAVSTALRWCEKVVVVVPRSRLAGCGRWKLAADTLSGGTPGGFDTGSDAQGPLTPTSALTVVAGGPSRSVSVRCGLQNVPDTAEVVLVHDGARPLAGDAIFERVIAAVRAGADAVVPVLEISDTLRHRDGGAVDRRDLLAVQTPQGFRLDALRAAHAAGVDATDDATLVEATGATVATVEGDSRNLKITTAHDLMVARALLSDGRLVSDQRHSTGGGNAANMPYGCG